MNTIFNKHISELVKIRHSVRNYDPSPLTEDIITKIENYIENVDNPFNKKVRIKLIKKDNFNKELKLGTYGVIKGANYFLLTACENDELSLIALGYTFEKVVLYCTSLGLGTVWLGVTFNKGDFAKAMNLEDNEILPIVSPLGYEGGKKSFLGKIFSKSTNLRKDFSEVFFDKNLDTPLELNNADEYKIPLEMVRLAPSAVNKQPWRVVKDNNNLHFYFANNKTSFTVDIGIALCHFHLSAIENNINGKFVKLEEIKDNKEKNLTYITSWIRE